MAFRDELLRAFDSLNDRLRGELSHQLDSMAGELTTAAEAERNAAAAEAAAGAAARAAEEIAAAREQAEREAAGRLEAAASKTASAVREAEERGRAAALAAAREQMITVRERLADAVRAIDDAQSLTEALDTLVRCASREAERAALLLAADGRLRGWRFDGFGPPVNDGRAFELPITEGGILAEALHGRRAAAVAGTSTSWPPFASGHDGRQGVAIPLIVGGQPVGVLYADHPTEESSLSDKPAAWAVVLEVLARHTARRLELMAASRAAQAVTASGREESKK